MNPIEPLASDRLYQPCVTDQFRFTTTVLAQEGFERVLDEIDCPTVLTR